MPPTEGETAVKLEENESAAPKKRLRPVKYRPNSSGEKEIPGTVKEMPLLEPKNRTALARILAPASRR